MSLHDMTSTGLFPRASTCAEASLDLANEAARENRKITYENKSALNNKVYYYYYNHYAGRLGLRT